MRVIRNLNNLKGIYIKHNFTICESEWNKLDLKIHDCNTLESFKKHIFNFIRRKQKTLLNYTIH